MYLHVCMRLFAAIMMGVGLLSPGVLRAVPVDTNGCELTILVSNEQVLANRVDRGVLFPVRVVYLECPGMPRVYLQEHLRSTTGPFAAVHVLQQQYDGTTNELVLPERTAQRLLEYLNYGPQTRPFDCMDFGHFIADVPYAHGEFIPKHWKFEPVAHGRDFEPGDLVALADGNPGQPNVQLKHAGVYLGNGLFLWKFGSINGLFVSDLSSMKLGFSAPVAKRMRPLLN